MSSGQLLFSFTPYDYIPGTANAAFLDEFANNDPGLVFNSTLYKTSFDIPWVPANYSAATGITAKIHWVPRTATSGYCIWQMSFQLIAPGTTAWGTDTPYTAGQQTVQTNAPGTAGLTTGILTESVITFTAAQAASLAAGSRARLFLSLSTSSTMSGDALVTAVSCWDT